jgi:hypothetical protein
MNLCMWTKSKKRAALIVGGLFLLGALLPYAIVGPFWGMIWMYVTAPFSFIADKGIGLDSNMPVLIFLITVVAAAFWGLFSYFLLCLVSRHAK